MSRVILQECPFEVFCNKDYKVCILSCDSCGGKKECVLTSTECLYFCESKTKTGKYKWKLKC